MQRMSWFYPSTLVYKIDSHTSTLNNSTGVNGEGPWEMSFAGKEVNESLNHYSATI